MTSSDPLQVWTPDACTLPTVDRPLRLAELDSLFTRLTALSPLSPLHARLHLTGDAGLEATVIDLTSRETRCCSFFSFTTTTIPGTGGTQVTLDIEVPAAHAPVLAALTHRARTIPAIPGTPSNE